MSIYLIQTKTVGVIDQHKPLALTRLWNWANCVESAYQTPFDR